jgi:alpha-ketoglutarate-dependent taurine dioxygenase
MDYEHIKEEFFKNGFVHYNSEKDKVDFEELENIASLFNKILIVGKNHVEKNRKIQIVSEEKMFGGEYLHWHTDQSYSSGNFHGTLLAYGSSDHETYTEFANMTLAYENLTEEQKNNFSKIKCTYGVPRNCENMLTGAQKRILNDRANIDVFEDGKEWPLLVEHPITGIKSIYYSPATFIKSNLPFDTNWLLEHCTKFSFKHKWKTGDILLWDNRRFIHRRMAFEGHRELFRICFKYE